MTTPRLTATAALTLFMVACIANAAPVVTTIPLEYASGDGCAFDARGATALQSVPGPDADGRIVIEAEAPTRYFCHPDFRRSDAPLPTDADASAGGFIDHVITARYQFVAPAAGEHWLWLRVSTPEGTSRIRDIVNGGMWYFLEEKDNEEPQDWHWVQRRSITLKEGLNHLTLTEFHLATPAIDQLIFSPVEDFTPDGTYDETRVAPAVASVETSPILIPGAQELLQVTGLPAQTSSVSASLAAGAWCEIPYDPATRCADISSIAPGQSLRLRVQLDADLQADPGKLALVARVESAQFVDISDGQTRCVFDTATGGLFLIEDLTAGRAVACPGVPRPLVSVDLKRAGEAQWTRIGPESVTEVLWEEVRERWVQVPQEPVAAEVRPKSCEGDSEHFTATFSFGMDGIGRTEVTYLIKPGEGGAWTWDVSAQVLEGPADLVAVEFPILDHLRLGASGLDDRQFRMQSFGHIALQPGMHPIRDERYPGSTVMPWQSLHDSDGGLYVGAHDPQAINLLFTSRASGIEGEHFAAGFRKLDDISPGEERSYSYVVATHPGSWHWGADRYREWFYETFGRASYPDWTKACDGFLDIQAENYRERFTFAGLVDWYDSGQAFGIDWMQVWGQFAFSLGPCCAAWYQPSPQYGGAEQLAEAAAQIKQRGGHVGGYYHYAYMDLLPIVTDWYLGHFRKSEYPGDTPWMTPEYFQRMQAISEPAGAVPPWPPADDELGEYLDQIDAHQAALAAGERAKTVFWWKTAWVNDPDWWEYLRFWIGDKYVREWNCNTAYIDVLGTGGAYEGYDPRRDQNGEGTWGLGRLGIARTVVEDATAADPDFVCSMEGLGDLPGLYCAAMCSGVYRGARNVMRYTFPERIFIHGAANAGSGSSYLDRYLLTFREAMRYDIGGLPGADCAALLQLQRSFKPWIYEAQFMDTLGLTTSHPRVEARWLHRSEGDATGALMTLTNRDYLPGQTVTFDASQIGGARAGFYVTHSGQAGALDLRRDGDDVTFDVPAELAAQLFFVAQAGGTESVWPVARLVPGDEPRVAVTLFNLTDQPQSGVCTIENLGFTEPREAELDRARVSLPMDTTNADFSIDPLQALTLDFPVQSLRRFYYTVRLRAALNLRDAADISREFLIIPFTNDGSFELAGNDEDQAAEGGRSLMLGPSLEGYQHRTAQLLVLPNRQYRVSVQMRRNGFAARVHGTALMIKDARGNAPIVREPSDTAAVDQWQTISYDFETPPDVQGVTLYLYNVESEDTAWFDDIHVEDLGPVEN